MKDRRLEFDSIIAICALLISCLAVCTSVYQTWVFRDQTRVIHDQYAATIWPYINVNDTTNTTGAGAATRVGLIQISLTNNGLGPALVRDAQLIVDGHQVAMWNELRDLYQSYEQQAGGKVTHAQMVSIDPSTTIRPGDSHDVFTEVFSKPLPMQQFLAHKVQMNLCYCSLNSQCWTLHYKISESNRSFPTPVSRCEATQSIQSSSA